MNNFNKKQREQIKSAWKKVDRKNIAESMGISVRVLDQYANALQVPGAKRTIIIESLTGIPAKILRPDIFR